MRLFVYLLQAKDLPVQQSFTKLRVGKSRFKTKISRSTNSPVWNQEFVFKLHAIDNDDVLVVSVYHHHDDFGFFSGSRDLVGSFQIPLSPLAAADNRTFPPTWYPLQRPSHGRFVNVDCGKILLAVSLSERGHEASNSHVICAPSDVNGEASKEMEYSGTLSHSHGVYSSKAPFLKISDGKHVMKGFIGHVAKLFHVQGETGKITDDSSDFSTILSDYEESLEEHTASTCNFKEALELMLSEHNVQDMPENLQGGVLLDEVYKVPPNDLNMFLFAPDCQFQKDLAEFQGTTDLEEGPWTLKAGDDGSCLSRIVTYTKAATKLVKAVKATEEQVYLKANGKEFAVFASVSTPEIPYGNTFKINLLYKILPGLEQPEGGKSSRLIISWGINFQQNTMMRSMIEGGARQGLKNSFDQFSDLLARNFTADTTKDVKDKDQILATLQTKKQSALTLACEYFCDYTVVSAFFLAFYVFVHIILCKYGKCEVLEFEGFDLPDSFGELFICGLLVLQLERVYYRVSRFINSQLQKGLLLGVTGSDCGVKAQGDGWILTVGLVEGVNLAKLDTKDSPDPYVVFSSNGKTRASSVKLQCHDPHWNEIIEFDAMEEPPSVLVVEVFDFDGPFNQSTSLGHAEINFLKHTSIELADLWVSLEGKLAQSSQTKLHLRIFLDNNNGFETIREYLTKMEKEVGKKLNLRSPHKNSAFQKLFELPPEEFLIGAFTCHLRRKMPLQGRLFLSARIVGFYANLFGHKTKFFFLWEDIEDIQVLPPSLASVGSPTLVIVLRKGRGFDARHGAKSQDEEGRLKFYFQSFVSFDAANRTIMALWRTRTLTPDQKAQIADEQQDLEERPVNIEEAASLSEGEEAKIYKIYNAELPLSVTSLMRLFEGGDFEQKIMEKCGCLNYTTTKWEVVKPGISERHVSYRFNHQVSIFGGEVTCAQRKSTLRDEKGWVVNEVMVLHDVPFCDHFQVQFEYEIEKSELAQNACKCDVSMRITWLKSTKCEQTVTQNVVKKFTDGFEEIFELAKKETLFAVIDDASN